MKHSSNTSFRRTVLHPRRCAVIPHGNRSIVDYKDCSHCSIRPSAGRAFSHLFSDFHEVFVETRPHLVTTLIQLPCTQILAFPPDTSLFRRFTIFLWGTGAALLFLEHHHHSPFGA